MKDVKLIDVVIDTLGVGKDANAVSVKYFNDNIVKNYPDYVMKSINVLGATEIGVRVFIVLVKE